MAADSIQIRMQAERDLERKGYRFISRQKCAFCGREFEWWRTPRGKLIPLTACNLEPHWRICGRAFRNKKPSMQTAGYFRQF